MATYSMQILLSNGQTINAYFGPNQAVGTYLPVDLSGPSFGKLSSGLRGCFSCVYSGCCD